MGCNCRCKCGDEETVEETATTTNTTQGPTNTTQGPIVSNVSQKRGTIGAGAQGKKIKRKTLRNLWGLFGAEGDNSDNPKLAGDGGVTPFEAAGRNNNLTAQKITDLADWFNYPQREQFLFNSEINEPMNGSSNTVDHINPTEVQGSEDIMGAEEVIWPQFTQNISGQGRTFANTIHPGMVIPNPDNYPTPEGNSPWAPYVNIRTYGDILDAVYPPYPSAMEWARNPQNYKEYPSTDWYTP